MREITLTIAGEPVPKARARVTKTGIAYTPAKTRRWEQTAAIMAQAEMRGQQPIEGPLEVTVLAQWQPPQSWPAWKRNAALISGIGHTAKPDADNIAKAALDAIQGVVFRDDSQVTGLIVRKSYGDIPGVTIRVRALDAMAAQVKRRIDIMESAA